jgi:hypothetical protein
MSTFLQSAIWWPWSCKGTPHSGLHLWSRRLIATFGGPQGGSSGQPLGDEGLSCVAFGPQGTVPELRQLPDSRLAASNQEKLAAVRHSKNAPGWRRH